VHFLYKKKYYRYTRCKMVVFTAYSWLRGNILPTNMILFMVDTIVGAVHSMKTIIYNITLPQYNTNIGRLGTLKSAISWSCWTGPLLYFSCLIIFSTFTFLPKNEWECLLVMPSCMVHSERSPKIFLLKMHTNRLPHRDFIICIVIVFITSKISSYLIS